MKHLTDIFVLAILKAIFSGNAMNVHTRVDDKPRIRQSKYSVKYTCWKDRTGGLIR